jgi:hypothetical protein
MAYSHGSVEDELRHLEAPVAISTDIFDALMPMMAATSRQPHISCSNALDIGESDTGYTRAAASCMRAAPTPTHRALRHGCTLQVERRWHRAARRHDFGAVCGCGDDAGLHISSPDTVVLGIASLQL